jgi:hypothetical protein
VKLWESIMDLSDFEVDRNRRRGSTGNRERISGNKSDGISAMGRFEFESDGCMLVL